MQAGLLRWPIVIEYPALSAPNATSGEQTNTWATFITTRANMETSARMGTKSAWELFVAAQTRAARLTLFQIRYQKGPTNIPAYPLGQIDESMRIRNPDDGRIWAIKSITDVMTRHRELWIFAEFGITTQ